MGERLRILFKLALVIAVISPAFAQDRVSFSTGNAFLRMCEGPDNQFACAAYVVGAWEMFGGMNALGGPMKNQVCAPASVTAPQLHDILIQYLRDVPAERHKPTTLLLVHALTKSYPCRR